MKNTIFDSLTKTLKQIGTAFDLSAGTKEFPTPKIPMYHTDRSAFRSDLEQLSKDNEGVYSCIKTKKR